MSNAMLGPPRAVTGGAVAGAGGSGVFSPKDPAGVGEEFMALVAGLLAGLVPAAQPQAQTATTAPGPNDGKVLTETDADAAGLALPQGLAEQAATAADVARAVLAVDPHACGPRSPKGLLHTHAEQGLRLDGAWTKEHGTARAQGLGGGEHGSRSGAPAAVSFTITPVGAAQDAPPPPVASTQDGTAPVPLPPAVPAETPEDTETPVVPAPTIPAPAAAQDDAAPTIPAPAAAQDDAAPIATAAAGVSPVDDEGREDDVVGLPPAGSSVASTERPKDVGQARQAVPAHSPHRLAHEIVDHLRVAVREQGREIQISLRPAELGNMTIRVTMQDGVLQAHIAADRPESARLLEQSLRHLEDMLADRGYAMGSLDVSTGGPDARETAPRTQDTPHHEHRRGRGHDHHSDDGPVAAGSAPVAVVAHDGDVNLLA